MRLPRLLVLASLAAPLGALAADPSAEVAWKGSLRAVHGGDGSAHVELEALAATPHLFAVGPLAGFGGELTVVDGTPHVARVRGGRVVASREPGVSASFLVWAHVARWSEPVALAEGPGDARTLDRLVEDAAARAGVDAARPFPFLLTGTFSSAAVHVLAPPGAAPSAGHGGSSSRLELRDVPGTAVGFFSKGHQGVFTHRDSHTHVHLVTADGRSGHVDTLAPGAAVRISFPAR